MSPGRSSIWQRKNLIIAGMIAVIMIYSCESNSTNVKHRQYLNSGSILYTKYCSNCHQENGEGLRELYPPLAGSDYLKHKINVICAVKNGLHGEIVVNSKVYNQPMPSNEKLTSLKWLLCSPLYTTPGITRRR